MKIEAKLLMFWTIEEELQLLSPDMSNFLKQLRGSKLLVERLDSIDFSNLQIIKHFWPLDDNFTYYISDAGTYHHIYERLTIEQATQALKKYNDSLVLFI